MSNVCWSAPGLVQTDTGHAIFYSGSNDPQYSIQLQLQKIQKIYLLKVKKSPEELKAVLKGHLNFIRKGLGIQNEGAE